MDIYQIKGLDCSKHTNRLLLLKEVKQVIKAESKPSIERLENICKSLQEKYKMPIRKFKQKDGKLFVSIETEQGSYSTLCCLSYYEALCKYILCVKAWKEYKKLEVK